MKVLVITRGAWRDSNNTGSTMSAIFSDFPADCTFYNLYCRSENPRNSVISSAFKISEYQLLHSLKTHQPVGCAVNKEAFDADISSESSKNERAIYQRCRRIGKTVSMPFQELLWTVANWKSDALDVYLDSIQPDVLFMPAFDSLYMYKLLQYVQARTGASVVLFHTDNNYALPRYTLSPLFWVCRLRLRRYIREAVSIAACNFCITERQCVEYAALFQKPFYLLTKSDAFSKMPPQTEKNKVLQMVYTGNIDKGRAKTLLKITKALQKINADGVKAQMHIYAGVLQNKQYHKRFSIPNTVVFHDAVPPEDLPALYEQADVLVYAEGMDKKGRFVAMQSFSSKLVDYFKAARCIFAVGVEDTAAMQHLEKYSAAVTAHNAAEIEEKLQLLLCQPNLLREFGENGWKCGAEHHNRREMKTMLYAELQKAASKKVISKNDFYGFD